MLAWYKSALSAHPLATKAITAASILSLSDIACQSFERTRMANTGWNWSDAAVSIRNLILYPHLQGSQWTENHHDWNRTFQVGVTGLTFSGPISHYWYQVLDKIVRVRSLWLNVCTKMVLDATIFSPFAVAGYFVWRSMLDGKGIKGTYSNLQMKWTTALVASWSFWPAANIM